MMSNLPPSVLFSGKSILRIFYMFSMVALVTAPVWAESDSKSKADFQGYFFGDAAYFNQLQGFKGESRPAEPYTRFIGGLVFSAQPTDNFRLVINPEFFSSTQLPLQPASEDATPGPSYVAYMEEGKGIWTYGDDNRPNLEFTLGWQYYKDNPHGKIFGDYLLRSMIYPALVFTKFHNSQGKFFGLRLENNFGSMFNHSVIAHTETQRYPFYDISLAYSANVDVGGIFDAGLGVHWVSAIPFKPSRTTPKGLTEYRNVPDNTYKIVPFQEGTEIRNDAGLVEKIISVGADPADPTFASITIVENEFDSNNVLIGSETTVRTGVEMIRAGQIEGLRGGSPPSEGGANIPDLRYLTTDESNNRDLYPELEAKGARMIRYTFAGQIITYRMGLTLGEADPFKLYTELAVLGWQNYEGFYEERSERIPIMFGVKVPTANFLDFLNFELEYYAAKKPASWLNRNRYNVPQPSSGLPEFDSPYLDEERAKQDDWKWGISTGKTFDGIGVKAQIGSDHMHSGTYSESFHEILSRPSEWYIMLRLMLSTSLISK